MTAYAFEESALARIHDPVAIVRARAAADARHLRALARTARIDGLPKAELRSANARAAARRVLDHARRVSSLRALPCDGTGLAELAG